MNRPGICAVIVNNDIKAAKEIEPDADLFEVRIDLIGDGWRELAGQLKKPWIACNRSADEGGSWQGTEAERRQELLSALELGPEIIDIELLTGNLKEIVKTIKEKAQCLISFHDLGGTPAVDTMREIVRKQMEAGADICKIATTAHQFEDNPAALQLIHDFPQTRVVAFAMGPLGITSRVLCPLAGGSFTYASIEPGKESAPGQITVKDLRKIYGMLQHE